MAAIAAAGLHVADADPAYLPSPLTEDLANVAGVHPVRLLVCGWKRECVDAWRKL
jgi:hypothetical protein